VQKRLVGLLSARQGLHLYESKMVNHIYYPENLFVSCLSHQ